MEDDLMYIKNLKVEELIDIVSNIWGFEEASEALLQLEKENPQKALELGIEILENDKGDDYFQATVWDIIFNLDPVTVINSLKKRKEKLGKVLLYDVLKELNSGFYLKEIRDLPEAVINRIINDCNDLPPNLDDELSAEFREFTEKINR